MKIYFASILVLGLFLACSTKTSDDSPVIATVGKTDLTINEIETVFLGETGLELSQTQIHRYVQRWIEKELIYQEALEGGLKENPEVEKNLLELEKDYLVNRFIQDYNSIDMSVSEQEIADYYERYSDEFIRKNDFYNLRVILVENYRSASALRREINSGTDFTTLAKNHSLDGSSAKGGLLGWVTIDKLDDDLARQISRLSVNQISSPIKTENGYYLVELLNVRLKDEVQTIEEVQVTILKRLQAEKKREKYENLVSELSEKYKMYSNFEVLKKYNSSSTN
jgi:parvulin-like peptidyl-prolyl isomerase